MTKSTIRSMTGYARADAAGPSGRIVWELRAVNHRYLDASFKLPEEFRPLESELRQMAVAQVTRGKLECGLRYLREHGTDTAIELDLDRVQQLREAAERVGEVWGPVAATDPLRLLAFPGVLREAATDFSPLLVAARALFEQALGEFNDSRAREGARLEVFLVERCTAVEALVATVRARFPQVRGLWLERLRARAAELGVELDANRLEQEMVMALQRLDVEEEMSRLLSHLSEVRGAMRQSQSVGRRLDFLMQELNREANTLSSKSQDAEMTRCAVEMKVAIEQMREQVQNIE